VQLQAIYLWHSGKRATFKHSAENLSSSDLQWINGNNFNN